MAWCREIVSSKPLDHHPTIWSRRNLQSSAPSPEEPPVTSTSKLRRKLQTGWGLTRHWSSHPTLFHSKMRRSWRLANRKSILRIRCKRIGKMERECARMATKLRSCRSISRRTTSGLTRRSAWLLWRLAWPVTKSLSGIGICAKRKASLLQDLARGRLEHEKHMSSLN